MFHPLLQDYQDNAQLIPLVKHVSQEKIDQFAVVAEGVGSIHVDRQFAGKTPFHATLAHGFVFVAYVSEMMENNFGLPWLENGALEIKNIGPANPGDTLVISGTVEKIETEGSTTKISCRVLVENHNNDKVAVGETSITCSR